MTLNASSASPRTVALSSSLAGDIWHPDKPSSAYEWWYFDALSDDGSEAVLITFLDNFVFSSQYNRNLSSSRVTSPIEFGRIPAVAFTYSCEDFPVIRVVNEFRESDFSANTATAECRIGSSSFRREAAEYGSGYFVSVTVELPGKGRIDAQFEWLSIEANLLPEKPCVEVRRHCWNLAVPRADVSGRITISDRSGRTSEVRHFRGTGYHDHKYDDRWLAGTVKDWQWGRAHFSDSTAIFHRYSEIEDESSNTKLLIVKDGELQDLDARVEEQFLTRDKFGIKYPTRLRVLSGDNVRLRVKPIKVIHSSVYMLRFLGQFTLTLRDSVPRKTVGLLEYLAPRTLRYRWLNWLGSISSKRSNKRSAT